MACGICLFRLRCSTEFSLDLLRRQQKCGNPWHANIPYFKAERGFLDELEIRRPDLLFQWQCTLSDEFDRIARDWIEAMAEIRRPSQIKQKSLNSLKKELGPI